MTAAASTRSTERKQSSLQAARSALTREHIMAAAEVVFAEQGFANTRMQDIARGAEVSLTTLYQSFPGKDELYRAVLIARDEQMLEEVMAEVQPLLQAPGTVEHILRLMEGHLRFLLNHPNYLKMQLQEGRVWYHSAAQPSLDEQLMWARGLAAMEQVFAWGISADLFVPGNVADHSRMLMAIEQARFANWMAAGMADEQADVIAQIQADFVRQFCRPGVAAKLLSVDGIGLNPNAIERIRAIGT